MLVELLRPAGPDLARRWVAALLLVPEGEREALVAQVERTLATRFGFPAAAVSSKTLKPMPSNGPGA